VRVWGASASSQLWALEAPGTTFGGRDAPHHLPSLDPRCIGALDAVRHGPIEHVGGLWHEAHVLPLRQRSGLLRAGWRDNEPSRGATNSATSNEDQGDSERAGVHATRVACSPWRGKALGPAAPSGSGLANRHKESRARRPKNSAEDAASNRGESTLNRAPPHPFLKSLGLAPSSREIVRGDFADDFEGAAGLAFP